MNIKDHHQLDKGLSTAFIFKTDGSSALSIQILKGAQLKEHVTKIPATLFCINGSVLFENEKGLKETMITGDYMLIEPNVKHWVDGLEDSQLVLVK